MRKEESKMGILDKFLFEYGIPLVGSVVGTFLIVAGLALYIIMEEMKE